MGLTELNLSGNARVDAPRSPCWDQHMRRLGLLVPFALLVLCAGTACSKPADEKSKGPLSGQLPEPATRCAKGVAPLGEHIERGISLAHNYQYGGRRGYGTKTSSASLRELKTLGVRSVSLTPFGFMRSLSDAQVHTVEDVPAGETDERVRREIRAAKALGLRVLLKPHLWVVGGAWRGQLDPGSAAAWQQWFQSYEAFILHYAELAQAEGVERLAIGVELKSTERRFESRWRQLVKEVRRRFSGELVYCANWDDVDAVPWWDAVDYIGVQFYAPLTDGAGLDEASIRKRLELAMTGLEQVSERSQRPVLFSEVGYRSARGSLSRPHEWPERSVNGEVDENAQALAYRLFIEAVRAHPWVRGVYWWKWFTDPNTAEEGPTGFSPRGKAAEAVLRSAYDGDCGPAPSSHD